MPFIFLSHSCIYTVPTYWYPIGKRFLSQSERSVSIPRQSMVIEPRVRDRTTLIYTGSKCVTLEEIEEMYNLNCSKFRKRKEQKVIKSDLSSFGCCQEETHSWISAEDGHLPSPPESSVPPQTQSLIPPGSHKKNITRIYIDVHERKLCIYAQHKNSFQVQKQQRSFGN